MFAHMREALGIDDKIDILTYIESLPTPEEQQLAHRKIEKVEEDAMNKMIAQEGLSGLMKVNDLWKFADTSFWKDEGCPLRFALATI